MATTVPDPTEPVPALAVSVVVVAGTIGVGVLTATPAELWALPELHAAATSARPTIRWCRRIP
jgi:hypothetical protein